MASPVPERLRWIPEVLAVEPGDRILEIGCGTGVVVELLCDRLGSGRVTAIDRSAKMIALAERRNRSHVESGRARLLHAALADAALNGERFDKVFASNVNVFWLGPAKELRVIRGVLAPGARLHLFHQPPSPGQVAGVVETCTRFLRDQGFEAVDVLAKEMHPAPTLCIVAAPSAA